MGHRAGTYPHHNLQKYEKKYIKTQNNPNTGTVFQLQETTTALTGDQTYYLQILCNHYESFEFITHSMECEMIQKYKILIIKNDNEFINDKITKSDNVSSMRWGTR